MATPARAPEVNMSAAPGAARSRKTANMCYPSHMTTVEDIEKAVAKLPPEELAAFRAWFEAFDAARFAEKIERDAAGGKLDRLADEAIADYRAGRAREI